jgi:CHASE2 domain-containing sensor protein
MELAGFLNGFEMFSLDRLLRIHDRQVSKKIVIVEITDEDYNNRDLFAGKSPLDSHLLVKLTSILRNYGPAVIGMDFDTESSDAWKINTPEFAAILPASGNSPIAASQTPVVWAEIPCNIVEPLILAQVLGGQLRDLHYLGIPRFPVDSDGMVRRYQGKFKVTETFKECPAKFVHTEEEVPSPKATSNTARSFARAVIDHACEDKRFDCSNLHSVDEPGESVIFNFYGDRYRFPIIQAHEFIGPDAEGASKDLQLQLNREKLLRDKIVIVGGSFNAARDVYLTPLGQMAGVELIALAVQSDFGGGIRETQKVLEMFADILVGSIIVLLYFYYRQRPRVAFYTSFFGVPAIATAFSVVLFRTAAYWFNFIPIIIGMVMHQMLELSKSCGELQDEIDDLKRKLHETSVVHAKPDVATSSQSAASPALKAELTPVTRPEITAESKTEISPTNKPETKF